MMFNYGRLPAMLAAGHPILPLSFRSSFLFLFLPPNLRGRLADRHQTLPHVRWHPDLCNSVRNFGGLPPKFGGPETSKFRRDFRHLRDLIANISGTQQDIVNRITALQTTDTPAQAKRCTTVLWSTNGEKKDQSCDPPNGRPSSWALPRIVDFHLVFSLNIRLSL